MADLTRWFSIDEDGQPVRPGCYETLYNGDHEECAEMTYWDGAKWRFEEDGGETAFGNWNTVGERWRGLAPPNTEGAGQ